MWRALAIRICYYLGYYKERIDTLEAKVAMLRARIEAYRDLEVTPCLVICDEEDCEAWDMFDTGVFLKVEGSSNLFLCQCGIIACQDCAIKGKWRSPNENTTIMCYNCLRNRPDIM